MRFQIGDCCCNPCGPGSHTCYDGKITRVPNAIYITISGEIYDPAITESQLKTSGVIPNNITNPAYTGWTISTEINYQPNILGWLFNKKFKLKNQTAWDYERLGEGVAEGTLCYDDNPFSGGRLDCVYNYSNITKINEELFVLGDYTGPSWEHKYFLENISSVPTGVEPEPSCPGASYMTVYDQSHYVCPNNHPFFSLSCGGEDGSSGPGTFICYNIGGLHPFTYFGDPLILFNEFFNTQGYATYYYETGISTVGTSESLTLFDTDDLHEVDLQVSSCGLGLIYPRIDFDWWYWAGASADGTIRLDAIGHELCDAELEEGNDPIGPGLSVFGITRVPGEGIDGSTYSAGATGPRVGFIIDFKTTVPNDYQTALIDASPFLPMTGASLTVGRTKARLDCSNTTYIIPHNNGGRVSIAYEYYHDIINSDTIERKDATYKVGTCAVRNIGVILTCDPTDALEVSI